MASPEGLRNFPSDFAVLTYFFMFIALKNHILNNFYEQQFL